MLCSPRTPNDAAWARRMGHYSMARPVAGWWHNTWRGGPPACLFMCQLACDGGTLGPEASQVKKKLGRTMWRYGNTRPQGAARCCTRAHVRLRTSEPHAVPAKRCPAKHGACPCVGVQRLRACRPDVARCGGAQLRLPLLHRRVACGVLPRRRGRATVRSAPRDAITRPCACCRASRSRCSLDSARCIEAQLDRCRIVCWASSNA
jgi:hypothetical protein